MDQATHGFHFQLCASIEKARVAFSLIVFVCLVSTCLRAFGAFEFYGQSLYTPNNVPSQQLLAESRIRYQTEFYGTYLSFYSNPYYYGPALGLIQSLYRPLALRVFVENRWLYSNQGHSQRIQGLPEIRFGFWGGGFQSFSNFFESDQYFDVIWIPRINSQPVATAWAKAQWVYPLWSNIKFGPMLQTWAQVSPSPDLGAESYQLRPGMIVKFWSQSPEWGLSAFFYERWDIKQKLILGPEITLFLSASWP
jgi:hypothetical protein